MYCGLFWGRDPSKFHVKTDTGENIIRSVSVTSAPQTAPRVSQRGETICVHFSGSSSKHFTTLLHIFVCKKTWQHRPYWQLINSYSRRNNDMNSCLALKQPRHSLSPWRVHLMHISVLLWGLMGLDDSNASSQGGPAFFSQYKQLTEWPSLLISARY